MPKSLNEYIRQWFAEGFTARVRRLSSDRREKEAASDKCKINVRKMKEEISFHCEDMKMECNGRSFKRILRRELEEESF